MVLEALHSSGFYNSPSKKPFDNGRINQEKSGIIYISNEYLNNSNAIIKKIFTAITTMRSA